MTNSDFANMDSWTTEEFHNRGRYHYDAEYHALVHVVGWVIANLFACWEPIEPWLPPEMWDRAMRPE